MLFAHWSGRATQAEAALAEVREEGRLERERALAIKQERDDMSDAYRPLAACLAPGGGPKENHAEPLTGLPDEPVTTDNGVRDMLHSCS